MSALPRSKNGAWVKANYEKIAVVIVLIALLGSALLLLVQVRQAERALVDAEWDHVDIQHRSYEPIEVDRFAPYVHALEDPFQIPEYPHAMMASDLRVVSVNPDAPTPIPFDAEVCPWTQYPQPDIGRRDSSGDGIPDAWYVDYELDPFDTGLAERDLDGDGFTVREEHEAGTSPVDPEDHPSHAIKLRVKQTDRRPFDLRFQGVHELAEGDIRYQINDQREGRTHFVRMGDEVAGHTVRDFEERRKPGPLGTRDASVLTLERADGRQVELVVGIEHDVQERIAELVFMVDQSTYIVSEGDEIELLGTIYKVIDIESDTVLIHDQRLDEEIRVERQTEAERAAPRGEERREHGERLDEEDFSF